MTVLSVTMKTLIPYGLQMSLGLPLGLLYIPKYFCFKKKKKKRRSKWFIFDYIDAFSCLLIGRLTTLKSPWNSPGTTFGKWLVGSPKTKTRADVRILHSCTKLKYSPFILYTRLISSLECEIGTAVETFREKNINVKPACHKILFAYFTLWKRC